MFFALVDANGNFSRLHDFGDETPPTLAAAKGEWRAFEEVDRPSYDALSETIVEEFVVLPSKVQRRWNVVQLPAEQAALNQENDAKARLLEVDLASIRAIREYIAAKPDAPAILIEREATAQAERGRIPPK